MGASRVTLAFGCEASFFLRVVLRLAFMRRSVTAARAAATGVSGVAQTASSMACFLLVSPSARRWSYAAARAPRAEVLTLGAAAALLLPVGCSPDTRAGSNSCSLRLVFRDRGGGVPLGSFSACQSCPQPECQQRGSAKRGEALAEVGSRRGLGGSEDFWMIIGLGDDATKPDKPAN